MHSLIALGGRAAHHVALSVQPSAKVGFDLRVVEDLRQAVLPAENRASRGDASFVVQRVAAGS